MGVGGVWEVERVSMGRGGGKFRPYEKRPPLGCLFGPKFRIHEKKGLSSLVFLIQDSDLMKKKVSLAGVFERKL